MSPELLKVTPRVANVHSNPSPSFQSLLSYWGGAHLRIASSGRSATALATAETSRWTARSREPGNSEVTRQGKPQLRLQVLPALLLQEIGARSEKLGLTKINLATVSGCLKLQRGFLVREIPSKPLICDSKSCN